MSRARLINTDFSNKIQEHQNSHRLVNFLENQQESNGEIICLVEMVWREEATTFLPSLSVNCVPSTTPRPKFLKAVMYADMIKIKV